MQADVAVIIVTYNSAECIRECLDSVLDPHSKITKHVIVVDNDSKDNTLEVLREYLPSIKLIATGKNLGFAAGVNLGASKADADFVLLLNPDTVVVEQAIDTIVSFARSHPKNGIYGGRTLRPDGSLEPSSCWAFPTLWSMGLFATGLSTVAPSSRLLNPEKMSHWKRDTVREVDVVTGCFLLANAKVWKELDGLDERFFVYGEDVDFAFRAHQAGYRPLICPDAKVIHEIGESSSSKSNKMRLLYRGKATLVRKHWHGMGRSVALFMLLFGTGLRALLGVVTSRFSTSESESGWKNLWNERREWISGY